MKLIWLLVAIAFGIGEAMTPSLTLIWFSIGAVVLIFLSGFIESILLQVIIFAIISTTLLVVVTKNIVKKDETHEYNTNLKAIINKTGIVKNDIFPNKTGIVTIDGEEWTAISLNGEVIKKDEIVEVVSIEGVKLIVRKIK
jgi:membrane protein implicated in regulation of membrane protease activity